MKTVKVVNLTNFDLGIRIHMRNQMLYLKEQGYDASIISNPGSYITGDCTNEDGLFVKTIPFPSRITPLSDLLTLIKLVRYFRKERFHIVHTHCIKPGLLGRMAARIAGVPAILYTIHGFHFHDEVRPSGITFYVWIERFAARFCQLILSQNREDLQTCRDRNICPEEKLRFLGNGIDIRRFHPESVTPEATAAKKKELGIPPEHKVVGAIGRLVREKGFHEYFEAARMLIKDRGHKVTFLSIGAASPAKGGIDPEALIKEFGLEGQLLFLGTRSDIPELISTMDLLVSPTWAEGIPRNVMEAFAMGKPVVGTDVRGTRETVEHEVNGLLVPVKSPVPLADGIERVLLDEELARKLGRQARATVEEKFDERSYFIRTDTWYRELLHRSRPDVDWDARLAPVPQNETRIS